MRRDYILWDWNGTLLDDTQATVAALNGMLKARDLPPCDFAMFRATFFFPARAFYEQLGMKVSDAEWDTLTREFFTRYRSEPRALNAETLATLEYVRAQGVRQSIISALRQDLLEAETTARGVAPFMECVYGVDNLDGASKLDRALELLTKIKDADPIVIGDSLHDFEVAQALGVRCVLCAQGSHSYERLARVAPTGNTLMDAVRLALNEKESR